MAKILIAIPTKERSEMVKEVLNYELIYYKNYEIDICYYDSSTDDKTRTAITMINKKYTTDIIYKCLDSNLCLDYKIIEMFKQFQKMKYDYYWLINDSISINDDLLEYVMQVIENGYDLIRLPLSGAGDVKDYVTSDINEWFKNCSQGMAHMASTIMSKSLLQIETDWEYLKNRYVYNNTLDEKHGYFFTVAFYLEQITKLSSFKGLFIGNRYRWRRDSPLKKEQIYWYNYVFETWAKSYPETILKLPDVYTDKEYVIKKSDNITPGRFAKEMLIHYRLKGIYDITVYKKYKKYFKYITLETDECCKGIAEASIEDLRRDYDNLFNIENEWESKLEVIENLLKDKNIFLYGAGFYGEKVIKKLLHDGFDDIIKGIVVTNPQNNMKKLCDINIYGIDEISRHEDCYFILCALPGAAARMKSELQKRGISRYIGLFDV